VLPVRADRDRHHNGCGTPAGAGLAAVGHPRQGRFSLQL